MNPEPLIPVHGGYSQIESFRIARLIYNLTVRFCNRYIEKHNRSHNRMIQAARTGFQKISEGYRASASSKTTEFTLTTFARESLNELRLDYEKFLFQNNLAVWSYDDRRLKTLIARNCATVDDVILWVLQEHKRQSDGQPPSPPSIPPIASIPSSLPEIAANAVITLTIAVSSLLDSQIEALENRFETENSVT
jgi:hypothetical protein